MASRCLSSGAGQGRFSPAKASNSLSDEEREIWPRRNDPMQKRKRRLVVVDEDDEEEENEVEEERGLEKIGNADEFVEEETDIIRVSDLGEPMVNHFRSFDYICNRYQLEDPVLLSPGDMRMKPYVAIIRVLDLNQVLVST